MANVKKFLDIEGVKCLWSKVSMQDYPNNETLMAVINAIDETKADKESPEFTGIPIAPTANPNTNTTQIATTEFVNTAINDISLKSISSIEQTTTSSADGGSNIITVSLNDGTVSTFTIKNGKTGSQGEKGDKGDKGEAGSTPVRGVDYWTDADIIQIKNYVDDAILGGAW